MNGRTNRLMYLALISAATAALIFSLHQDRLYQRVSYLMLTTASMEAAANAGAIGERLPEP